MRKYIILFIILVISSCQKAEEPPVTVYQIDKGLEYYLQIFLGEAKQRGIDIKTENLIMAFGKTSTEICGQCDKVANGGQRTVTINNDNFCWKESPFENREVLVFHELGHCLLGRLHRDELLPNGAVISIMNSKGNDPYSPCIYALGGDNTCNKTARRSYYIDELFDMKTPIPAWAK